MTSQKSGQFKKFMISFRKSTGAGLTNAPIWVIQKSGKRMYNRKQRRTWKDVGMMELFKKATKKSKKKTKKLAPPRKRIKKAKKLRKYRW